jgi:hypothetical protein
VVAYFDPTSTAQSRRTCFHEFEKQKMKNKLIPPLRRKFFEARLSCFHFSPSAQSRLRWRSERLLNEAGPRAYRSFLHRNGPKALAGPR